MSKAQNKKEEDKKEKGSLMARSQEHLHSDSSYCRETFQRKIGKDWFPSLFSKSWFLLTNAIIGMQFLASVS